MFLVVLLGSGEIKGQVATWSQTWSGIGASPLGASSLGINVASASITRVNLTSISSSARYNSGGWNSTSNYLTITVTPNSGFVLNLNSQTFTASLGSSGTGPQGYLLYSSVDSYATSLGTLTSNCSGQTQTIITLPSIGFNGLASITFRILAVQTGCSSGLASGGTGGPSAIVVGGSVSSVTPVNTVSAASTAPTLCVNTALTVITHTTTGATGIGTTTTNYNLPTGVTAAWANNTITISGTPTASGTFNYSIPLTGGSGSVNATGTIYVNPAPGASASNNGPYCSGATIQLTGGPSGLSSYTWSGPNSYSSSNVTQTVSQNFDSLSTGTSWTDNSTLPGWYLSTTLFKIGTGSDNTGSAYNFGNNSNSTDRALGSLCSNNTVTIYYGIKITNTTGITVSSVAITYTGEQYRDAGNTSPIAQNLTVDYSTDATTLTTAPGTWTPVPALTFSTPIYTTTPGALDGNVSANRVAGITTTLTGLSIPNGSSIWVRWADQNDSGNDAAVAIDDVSIVLRAGISSPTIASATTAMSGNYILTTTNTFGCTSTATTNVVVNPNLAASVTIASNALNNTICSGKSVTFSATPTNGGAAPSYQWKLNGSNVGTNSVTYITTTLSDNDVVSVVMTSNASPCLTNSSANSNNVTMIVKQNPLTTSIYHQ